jgi:hypothetical protein
MATFINLILKLKKAGIVTARIFLSRDPLDRTLPESTNAKGFAHDQRQLLQMVINASNDGVVVAEKEGEQDNI